MSSTHGSTGIPFRSIRENGGVVEDKKVVDEAASSDVFLERYQRHLLQQQGRSEASFARSVIMRICQKFDIDCSNAARDPGFGFQWLHEQCPHLPIRFDSRKVNVNLGDMFSAMTKTEVWDLFMSALEETSCSTLALFLRVPGAGTFVIHNAWGLEQVPGFTRLVRVAKTADKGIIFEPLEAFLESIRLRGWMH